MAVNHSNEAAAFRRNIKNFNASYKTEALYYLALCDLKNGKNDMARIKLLNYADQPGALQKQKAASMLAELK
jgi:hypothetical protein